jgi:rare lipoprotein A
MLLLVSVIGCTSAPEDEPDGKPLREIVAADVAAVTPQPETLLMAGNTSPYRVNGVEYSVLDSGAGYRERGRASWYGRKFHGRRTANGEVFDAYAATAAHRSLPIPGYVRVTNLDNGRSLVVRVNDRGPFHPERIIDLSYGAAVSLGFAEQGTAPVEVVALTVQGSQDLRGSGWTSQYRYLQVASFSEPAPAQRMQARLTDQLGAPVAVSEVHVAGSTRYRVKVGPVESREALGALQAQIEDMGYGAPTLLPQ